MKPNYLKIITITFKKISEKLMELYLGLDLSRFALLSSFVSTEWLIIEN